MSVAVVVENLRLYHFLLHIVSNDYELLAYCSLLLYGYMYLKLPLIKALGKYAVTDVPES